MAHMPINHPFRRLYRLFAGICGLALLGLGAFASEGPWINTSGTILTVGLGAVTLAGAVVGANLGRVLHLVVGVALLVVGMASLALLRSDANVFGFSMTSCVVAFLIGLALLTCGLYEQVGPSEKQEREEQFRHGQAPDPEEHLLGAHQVPRSGSARPS
jgi:hypothetical protein